MDLAGDEKPSRSEQSDSYYSTTSNEQKSNSDYEMQSFDEEDKDKPIIKASSSHISDKSNVERTTNLEGNNNNNNTNEKKEGDRDLLDKSIKVTDNLNVNNNTNEKKEGDDREIDFHEALRNSNQTEKQNHLQTSQFRRTSSQPINPQLTHSTTQLNSSQSIKNRTSPFKKMFASSNKSNKNINLEEKENVQEVNDENDRNSNDLVDNDEFKKRIERRHYNEVLKVLLKAGCCSPSDLDELKQLRERFHISEDEHKKMIEDLGWSWEALRLASQKYLQQKYSIGEEKHLNALEEIGLSKKEYNLSILKGMEQVGEETFGEHRDYVIKTVPCDQIEYSHFHGFISMKQFNNKHEKNRIALSFLFCQSSSSVLYHPLEEPHQRQWIEKPPKGEKEGLFHKTLYRYLYDREKEERRVHWEELFYDLTYVGIVSTLTHAFAADLAKWFDFLILFMAIWFIYYQSFLYYSRFDTRMSINDTIIHAGSRGFSICYMLALFCILAMYAWAEFFQLFGYDSVQTKYPGKKTYSPLIFVLLIFLYISPWLASTIHNKYWYWYWLPALVFSYLIDMVRSLIDYVPINIEHGVERLGLFMMIIFGEVIISLITFTSFDYNFNNYLMTMLGVLLVYSLKIIYFDIQGMKKKLHALYRNRFCACIWFFSHLVLATALACISVGVNGLKNKVARENNQTNTGSGGHKRFALEDTIRTDSIFVLKRYQDELNSSTQNLTRDQTFIKDNYGFVLYTGTPQPGDILGVALGVCMMCFGVQSFLSLERKNHLIPRKIHCIILVFSGLNLLYLPFLPNLDGILLLGVCSLLVAFVVVILCIGTIKTKDKNLGNIEDEEYLENEAERRVRRMSQAHDSITIEDARRLSHLFESSHNDT